MGAKVEITSMELIKPSSPTPSVNKHLKPSFLDQVSPPLFVPLIFFYQNQSSSCSEEILDPSEKSQHLKQSLSEELTKFYPLAGKVNGDLSIDCDDSGALFVEALVHAPLTQAFQNAPLEKLNQFLPFDPFEMDSGKLLMDTYPRNVILLAVQISWFECGGNVIGVCISHRVADVMSLVTFMKSWATTSRSAKSTNPIVVKEPDFVLGRHLFPPLDMNLLPTTNPDPDDPEPEPALIEPPLAKEKIVCKRFLFSKEKIAKLRKPISPLIVKDPTRVEVVTGFLWKHFINLERGKSQAVKTTFAAKHAVNLRSRMSRLASHDEFPFGNFSIFTSASFMSKEDQEEKGYHDLVWLTSTAMRKVNEDYVNQTVLSSPLAYLNSLYSSGTKDLQEEEVIPNNCYFSSWTRFPMYEVDFGWGEPVLVTPAGTSTNHALVILMGSKCGDGIEAWIGLREDAVALFPAEFLSLEISDIFPIN